MQNITIQLPDRLVERLKAIADDHEDTDASLTASHILTRTLQQHNPRSAIMTDRGQRPGAQHDPAPGLGGARQVRHVHPLGALRHPGRQWKGETIPGIGEWIMKRAEIPVAEYEQLAACSSTRSSSMPRSGSRWPSARARSTSSSPPSTTTASACSSPDATDYNIVDATPFGRDPLKELAEACQKQGIRLGFYYSQTQDWHHPDGDGNDWDYDEEAKDFDGYVRGPMSRPKCTSC